MPDITKTRRKDLPVESTEANDTRWIYGAEDQCGMKNSLFTNRDTHTCILCGKRIQGILCCVPATEDEEGNGPMYCKKCGRPGVTLIEEASQQSEVSSLQWSHQSLMSERMEHCYSQYWNHCKDMNPSGSACHDVIEMIQKSYRRNVEIEKKLLELKRKSVNSAVRIV